MIRVMLVDDHTSFREAVAFMLGSSPDLSVVAQAGSVAEARTVLATVIVDVALVDLELGDGYGLDLLPAFRQHNADAAVIVLTGGIRPESKALAIAAGAEGFLHKVTDVEEIRDAIRQVAAGQPLLSPREALLLIREATQYQARTESVQRGLALLTARERDVLRALAHGLDNQAIADRLHINTTTVRTHVAQILHKLEVESRLQAALFAVRHGLVTLDELG